MVLVEAGPTIRGGCCPTACYGTRRIWSRETDPPGEDRNPVREAAIPRARWARCRPPPGSSALARTRLRATTAGRGAAGTHLGVLAGEALGPGRQPANPRARAAPRRAHEERTPAGGPASVVLTRGYRKRTGRQQGLRGRAPQGPRCHRGHVEQGETGLAARSGHHVQLDEPDLV